MRPLKLAAWYVVNAAITVLAELRDLLDSIS